MLLQLLSDKRERERDREIERRDKREKRERERLMLEEMEHKKKAVMAGPWGTYNLMVVYYESIKRKLKIKLTYACRCYERLQTKTKEFTRLAYTGLVVEN